MIKLCTKTWGPNIVNEVKKCRVMYQRKTINATLYNKSLRMPTSTRREDWQATMRVLENKSEKFFITKLLCLKVKVFNNWLAMVFIQLFKRGDTGWRAKERLWTASVAGAVYLIHAAPTFTKMKCYLLHFTRIRHMWNEFQVRIFKRYVGSISTVRDFHCSWVQY